MEQEKTTRIRNQLLQDLSNTRVNRRVRLDTRVFSLIWGSGSSLLLI